ncbi:MAG: hypothetical protein V1793_01125, partial [Pseudomonadota bacterium]
LMYVHIVIQNNTLQIYLQNRNKTYNIMATSLGTPAMMIQTIFKASRNFIFIPPLTVTEANMRGAPGGHKHNRFISA